LRQAVVFIKLGELFRDLPVEEEPVGRPGSNERQSMGEHMNKIKMALAGLAAVGAALVAAPEPAKAQGFGISVGFGHGGFGYGHRGYYRPIGYGYRH
jgi:hypothetical protein